MNVINKLRYHGFWLIDKLKGSPIKKDLVDIKTTLRIKSFSLLQKKREPILKKLLDTAVNYSDFYNEYKNYKNIEDFPVVNKLIIKQNLDLINIIPKTSTGLVKVSSSGSTGTPFEVYQTKRKAIRNKADVIYFANLAGYTIGDQLLFTRFWLDKYRKSFLSKKLSNIIEIDVEDDLTDKKTSELISRIQKDKQTKGFIGYPSGFEKICKYLDKVNSKPLNCNIQSIIATSEALFDNVRNKMEYYFKSSIVSRYSNEENGIISQQMINDKTFTINWASFHVEIFDINEDKPAKLGDLGRIIITDLYNFATPIIRYDTGDLGKFCNYNNDAIPRFELITGRKKDVLYNTKGEIVNPFVFYNGLTKFPEINQFQIIQSSKTEYVFKININSKFKKELDFLTYYKSFLGAGSKITIDYVNEIPLLNSGKRRMIINLYKKEDENISHDE